MQWHNLCCQFLQAPFDTVANNRIALLFGNSEAHSHSVICRRCGLQNKIRGSPALASSNAQEIGALFQAQQIAFGRRFRVMR